MSIISSKLMGGLGNYLFQIAVAYSKSLDLNMEFKLNINIAQVVHTNPVNDSKNNLKYSKYKELANMQSKYIFGGRLTQYKYYDMHQIIKSALNLVKTLIYE